MNNNLKSACDAILQKVATGKDRVPGVVAMITDRSANIYEGAAGERTLGASQAMTTDTVFAIFSTTKAITGTAVLQCVEEGRLDLDAPAKTLRPRHRKARGARRVRCCRQAQAARAEARHYHPHADATHGGPWL